VKRWALGRYAAVGAVATAAHWAVLAMLVEAAGTPAWVASGVGAVVGSQVAFFGNRRFTFGYAPEGAGQAVRAWRRFMGTALLGAGAGMAIVAVGVGLGAHYLLAQALATSAVMLLTFAVNRAWTFAR
jgi:putative flippase GtrA